MKAKFIKDYAFAHRGVMVEYFKAGEEKEVTVEVYESALRNGVIESGKEAAEKEEVKPEKKPKK